MTQETRYAIEINGTEGMDAMEVIELQEKHGAVDTLWESGGGNYALVFDDKQVFEQASKDINDSSDLIEVSEDEEGNDGVFRYENAIEGFYFKNYKI